ncbi:ABC transporter ATP-binding protein [Acrocarpospora catenulata]|uniref:ABC transporter ATP-binding protein n=1 Tax=Acrocarpospora catenulata TaxID=2836182 RepID=UPI001BDA7CD9|nr:ATP-binding cassette domain-containing protein [Acrocarpospora catenulata]
MRVSELYFRYRRNDPWVLTEVALDLAPGSVIEVAGPNGTGKSTLLRLLAGLLQPTKGTISGRPALVGYAPERFPAAQPFTVAGYLRHMAAVRGLAPEVIEEWTARLRMDHLLGQRLPDLSKGSAHKVGLAQALFCSPGLLILDEPFAGLDQATRAEVALAVERLAADGGIVVASDHQGDLRGLPGVIRYEVRESRVWRREVEEAAEPLVTVSVRLPLSRAGLLTARLRAEGHEPLLDQDPALNQDPSFNPSSAQDHSLSPDHSLSREPLLGQEAE